jgi:hypothetical protein
MRRASAGFAVSPLVAATLVCLAILLASIARWSQGYRPRLPLEHSNVAYSLASGAGYSNPFGVASGPTAWIPPGIPVAYAGALRLAWALHVDERAPIVGINLLAAGLAAFLVLRFCLSRWRARSRTAFCAAFLGYAILDPDFLVSSAPLTAAGTALLLAGLSETAKNPGGLTPWAMVFAASGLLAALHPGLALAGALASVGACLFTERKVGTHARSVAFAAIAGIAMSAGPWTLRNYCVFHQWIPAKSNGAFELVLSQRETDNGVLSESSLMVGHPSTNPRLLAEYSKLGERAFLDPYRREAGDIFKTELGRYGRFCLNRLYNALCFSQQPADIQIVSVRLKADEAARLVGQRLILMCAGTPNFFWARDTEPVEAELAQLRSAGAGNPDELLGDWSRAQAAIQSRTEGVGARFTCFAWSGFPTLCFIAALAAARRSTPRLVLGGAAIYLVALIPNILITHDMRHQGSFMLIFALLVAGAVEAVARSAASVRRTQTH